MRNRWFWNATVACVQRRPLFILLNNFINLLAMNGQLGRRLDSELDGILIDSQDLHDDLSINDYAFIQFSGEYEHS